MTFFRKTGYIRSTNPRRACSVAVEVDWHENGLHCFGPVERLLSDNMNNFDDLSEVVDISPSGQCRKRVLQPSNDAMLVAKRARHSGGGKIPAKACKHDDENGDFCQVEKLTDDTMFNYTKLYSVADKAVQDQKILTLMKITSPPPRVDNARRQRDRAKC